MIKARNVSLSFVLVLSLVVVARAALPAVLKNVLNKKLNALADYHGHIDDLDLFLLKGTVYLEGLEIKERDNPKPIPYARIESLAISTLWPALFRGQFKGDITAVRPTIHWRQLAKKKEAGVPGEKPTRDVKKIIFPFDVGRLTVTEGNLDYIDARLDPPEQLKATEIHAVMSDFSNIRRNNQELTRLDLRSTVAEKGRLIASFRFLPGAPRPSFDLNAQLQNLPITSLNAWLEKTIRIDVEEGDLSLFVEAKAENGQFAGYVKPIVSDLDVLDLKNEDKGLGGLVREQLAEALAEVFENQRGDSNATRIPIRGTVGGADTQIGVWKALSMVLRHAFVKAIRPGLDKEVTLG